MKTSTVSTGSKVNKGRRAAVMTLLIAASIAGGAWTLHERRVASEAGAVVGAAEGRVRGPRYAMGRQYRYRIAWTGRETIRPWRERDGNAMNAAMDLELDAVLVPFGRTGHVTHLVARFENVVKHGLNLLGTDALPDDARAQEALVGRTAGVDMDDSGEIVAVRFRDGELDAFTSLAPFLLRVLDAKIAEDASEIWKTDERGPFGASSAQYARESGAIVRTRLGYSRLDGLGLEGAKGSLEAKAAQVEGRTEIALAEGGPIQRVALAESVRVPGTPAPFEGEVRASARLLGEEAVALLPTHTDELKNDAAGPSLSARQKMLDQRVAGMTRAQLAAEVTAYAPGGSPPDRGRWLWRATGLLIKEPKAAEDMGKAFADPHMGPVGRAFVADVLASAGTKESQAVLRRVVTSSAVDGEAERARLVGRFAMVDAPDRETVRFVGDLARDAAHGGDADVARASLLAYGATVDGARRNGDDDTANDAQRTIESDVRNAQTPTDRAVALRALGNAAAPGAAGVAAAWVHDPAPAVRAAAAAALRATPDASAVPLLVELVGDPMAAVALAALDALSSRPLDEATMAGMLALLDADRVPGAAYGALVNVAAPYVGAAPSAEAILRTVLERPGTPAGVQAKIRGVLGLS